MADAKRQPMSADLLRQRRNLLVASLVLVTINLAGAEIKKKLSVSGAEITFSQPERIIWGDMGSLVLLRSTLVAVPA